jgi:hypothetical protein
MEKFLRQAWDELFGTWKEAGRVTALWQPTLPAAPWLVPAVAVGALIALVILSGVSLFALGVLLTALLASYLIIAGVFGVSIEIAPR